MFSSPSYFGATHDPKKSRGIASEKLQMFRYLLSTELLFYVESLSHYQQMYVYSSGCCHGFAGLRTGVFFKHMLRSYCLIVRVLQVCGQAFLWHMVRCLMSVLFMVGRGHESPDVMSFLTDLERQASKQPVARVQNFTIREKTK